LRLDGGGLDGRGGSSEGKLLVRRALGGRTGTKSFPRYRRLDGRGRPTERRGARAGSHLYWRSEGGGTSGELLIFELSFVIVGEATLHEGIKLVIGLDVEVLVVVVRESNGRRRTAVEVVRIVWYVVKVVELDAHSTVAEDLVRVADFSTSAVVSLFPSVLLFFLLLPALVNVGARSGRTKRRRVLPSSGGGGDSG
jgi:hypothetical protein